MTSEQISAFPIPSITDEDRAFWEGVQEGKFLIQKCLDCNKLQFFPRPRCVSCFSRNLGWQQSKGVGTVYSFTPVYIPLHPAVGQYLKETGILPISALIDLDEGIRIISEIVGSKPEDVKIGARVEVSFEEARGASFKLPKFHLMKRDR
jgi:uncharacterized OB-fold protein